MISPSDLEPFGSDGEYLGFLHGSEVPPADLRQAMGQVVELAKDVKAARSDVHWQIATTLVYIIDSVNQILIAHAREIGELKGKNSGLDGRVQKLEMFVSTEDDETSH